MKDLIKCNQAITEFIRDHFQTRSCDHDFTLVHPKHIPYVAPLVLSGVIHCTKRRQSFDVAEGHIVGLSALLNREPFPYQIDIIKPAEIAFVDRTTFLELSELPGNPLKTLTPLVAVS